MVNGNKLVNAFTEFEDFVQTRQDIQDTYAGHCSTHGFVSQKCAHPGRVQSASDEIEEKVVVPPRRPGQKEKQNANFEAYDNVNYDGDFG
ncbi:MAG TPA: hypothetical protein PLK30_17935 [Blastocatellia bacterium]|nr:hypothetical protein [Blastocatellia bacterium]